MGRHLELKVRCDGGCDRILAVCAITFAGTGRSASFDERVESPATLNPLIFVVIIVVLAIVAVVSLMRRRRA